MVFLSLFLQIIIIIIIFTIIFILLSIFHFLKIKLIQYIVMRITEQISSKILKTYGKQEKRNSMRQPDRSIFSLSDSSDTSDEEHYSLVPLVIDEQATELCATSDGDIGDNKLEMSDSFHLISTDSAGFRIEDVHTKTSVNHLAMEPKNDVISISTVDVKEDDDFDNILNSLDIVVLSGNEEDQRQISTRWQKNENNSFNVDDELRLWLSVSEDENSDRETESFNAERENKGKSCGQSTVTRNGTPLTDKQEVRTLLNDMVISCSLTVNSNNAEIETKSLMNNDCNTDEDDEFETYFKHKRKYKKKKNRESKKSKKKKDKREHKRHKNRVKNDDSKPSVDLLTDAIDESSNSKRYFC